MFKKIFEQLCVKNDVAPTAVCQQIGLSNAAYSCWTEDTVPRKTTLLKLADYFGVSVDYLLGKEEQKEPTVALDDELGEDVVIFHRDGKNQRRQLTREQMDMLIGMLNAIPENPTDL